MIKMHKDKASEKSEQDLEKNKNEQCENPSSAESDSNQNISDEDILEKNNDEKSDEKNADSSKCEVPDKDKEKEKEKEEHAAELEKANKNLQEENAKLKSDMETLKDRLLRISAEYDNFRKRTAKEKEGIYNDACSDVLKNMLPVVDNLEKAAAAEGDIDSLKQGIEMTLRQFNDSLGKLDVEEIPTDIPFDPNMHSAVMHVEDENFKQNEIAEVFQKGYKRGDKVIRYSMVKVAN